MAGGSLAERRDVYQHRAAHVRYRIHLTPPMDPHQRAVSVWYRIAGLISREQKDLAVEIIEAEIRSGQQEPCLRQRSSCSVV